MNAASDDDIAFLSGSPVRAAVIERLTAGPARPAELVEYAGVSRTTVHRTLSELCDRGWARRVEDGYDVTPIGELALETYRGACDGFATLREFEPFLSAAGDDVDVDLGWLSTAVLETPTETAPRRAFEWYADRLAAIEGDGLRGTTPVMNRSVMHAHEPIVGSEPTTLILGEATFRSVGDRYGRQLREALATEGFDLYVSSETPSIGLTLYGDTVFLGAYDDDRQLAGIVESDDERLYCWAETRFDRIRSAARPISAEAVAGSE